MITIHGIILYGSFLAFPFLFFCILKLIKLKKNNYSHKKNYYSVLFLIFLSIIFIYSRFIEPQIIVEQKQKIQVWFKSRIVVISDIHLWAYKDSSFLKRVVEKINNLENIDAVLIAWDLTYIPQDNVSILLSPLKDLKYKAYAVIWNHDDGHPWIPIEEEVKAALIKNNVVYLHNEEAIIPNTNIKILWLWDSWEQEDDTKLIYNYRKEDNLIILTHNPDTTLKYTKTNWEIADITITGHTHWWQIRIPFIYKSEIPTSWDFDEWYYDRWWTKLFVSSGLWEVGLPMRLGIPPVIDILDLE